MGDDRFSAFLQTNDGNYILAGYSRSDSSGDKTQSSRGYSDYWILKVDTLGNKLWDKRFGGTEWETLTSLIQTLDGGFVLGGYSSSGISGDKTQANWDSMNSFTDYWIVKIDSGGVKQWDKRFGGVNYDELSSLQQTKDGGYILAGSSLSTIGGDKTESNWDATLQTFDYWIVKIDSAGGKQWDKRFGGTKNDVLNVVQQTKDGGYILGGYSISDSSGDRSAASFGDNDYWIIKLDSYGNKEWDKAYGGASNDYLTALLQTADGGYLLGGESWSGASGSKSQASNGQSDYWIVKIDSAGNKEWDKSFGSYLIEEVFNVIAAKYGGYLICGDSYSSAGGDKSENNLGYEQMWLVKIDSRGNKEWDKTIFTLGHDENGLALQTPDGAYLLANCTNAEVGGYKTQFNWDTPSISFPIYDYWVVKFYDTTHFPFMASAAFNNATCSNLCNGSASVTPLNGRPPYRYSWQPSNDTVAALSNLCPGTYMVTITDSAGLTTTDTIIISYPPPITVNIIADTTTICANDTAHICANQGFSGYRWSNGDSSVCVSTSLAANYDLTVTENNGCTAVSNHISITVHSLPAVSINEQGDTLTTNNSGVYQWYFNNTIINGANSITYVANESGNYSVVVTDSNGCVATSSIVFVVSGVDVLSSNTNNFIYPNPTTSILYVELFRKGVYSVDVFDNLGKKLFNKEGRKDLATGTVDIDLSGFSGGIYLIKVTLDGVARTGKIALLK